MEIAGAGLRSVVSTAVGRIWGVALDLAFPPSCGVCGAEGTFLCTGCEAGLPRALPPRCPRCWSASGLGLCTDCARAPSALSGARAVYCFEGGARKLVLDLKYRSLYALAEPMGELLALYLLQHPMEVDLVVPVPLHRRRQRLRGFNQAEALGRVVGRRLELPLDGGALRRRRNTPQQIRIEGRAPREANVRDAFVCVRPVAGRSVLLVDDVLTTGATVGECARILQQTGAKAIWALTFARADGAV